MRSGKSGAPSPATQRGILTRAVELDVIPRLLARRLLARQLLAPAHAARPAAAPAPIPAIIPVSIHVPHGPRLAPAAPQVPAITLAQVIELTDLALAPGESGVLAFVAGLQAQGVPVETLYLDLLTPSARRLGVFWVEDVCDFAQVTLGVGRLHDALRILGPAFLATARLGGPPPGRILLAPLPGEQHTFGLAMVADFFRHAGWSVRAGPVATRQELAANLRDEWTDVLGFTFACDAQVDGARAEIAAARRASRNPALAVMVGGPPFVANPGLAASLGADGTASDGRQAVIEATTLLRRAATPMRRSY